MIEEEDEEEGEREVEERCPYLIKGRKNSEFVMEYSVMKISKVQKFQKNNKIYFLQHII